MHIQTAKSVKPLLNTTVGRAYVSGSAINLAGWNNEDATARKIFSAVKTLGSTRSIKQTCGAFAKAVKVDFPTLCDLNDEHNLVIKEYPVYLKNEQRRARHDFVIMLQDGRKIAIETKSANVGTAMVETTSTDVFQRFLQSDCDMFVYVIGGAESKKGKYQAARKLAALKKNVKGSFRKTLENNTYLSTLEELEATIVLAANS